MAEGIDLMIERCDEAAAALSEALRNNHFRSPVLSEEASEYIKRYYALGFADVTKGLDLAQLLSLWDAERQKVMFSEYEGKNLKINCFVIDYKDSDIYLVRLASCEIVGRNFSLSVTRDKGYMHYGAMYGISNLRADQSVTLDYDRSLKCEFRYVGNGFFQTEEFDVRRVMPFLDIFQSIGCHGSQIENIEESHSAIYEMIRSPEELN